MFLYTELTSEVISNTKSDVSIAGKWDIGEHQRLSRLTGSRVANEACFETACCV